jgi:diadenosine tetraphosphate (Ap4A) HIT family hydrolase
MIYNKGMKDCIFCQIAKGEASAEIIWENENFLAFLDIFPVVPGATVVIPKKHYDSYIKNVEKDVICNLMGACKEVMDLLDKKLKDNIQTKLTFEGLEVDHLHGKLWPMYPGVKEQVPTEKADPKALKKLAEKIRD